MECNRSSRTFDSPPSHNLFGTPLYTENVLQLAPWILAATLLAQSPPAQLQPGVIVPNQVCAAKPDQSYALYLPSHYSPDKRWPIVYAFDPNGSGDVPVKLMKDAAERYGYIVVGSNNSKNGSWKIEGDAAQAMWDDTHARFAIDDRRIYFTGFSGGARVSAVLAQRCKCAAGVLLDGAGFGSTPPSRDNSFAVFATVGTYDFNYPELSDLDGKLEQSGFPHALRPFDGSHQWAPANIIDEAFAWFQLIAMKQNREARDEPFISQQKNDAVARAKALEQSGKIYEAWQEYRQAASTFDGLTDTASLQQAATSLAQQKTVRDGAKREAQEFQEQNQLTSAIYSGLVAMRGNAAGSTQPSPQNSQSAGTLQPRSGLGTSHDNSPDSSDTFHHVQQQIIDLRQRSASDKKEDKVRVYRRALMGVYVGCGEFGDEAVTARNYALAKDYYQLATDAKPASPGGLMGLATVQSLEGDRKGAMETLRRAKEKSKDPAAFSVWLNDEPAFAKLRDDPQFRALAGP
jgi:tetratricopeptide (TPR) repeat protein